MYFVEHALDIFQVMNYINHHDLIECRTVKTQYPGAYLQSGHILQPQRLDRT